MKTSAKCIRLGFFGLAVACGSGTPKDPAPPAAPLPRTTGGTNGLPAETGPPQEAPGTGPGGLGAPPIDGHLGAPGGAEVLNVAEANVILNIAALQGAQTQAEIRAGEHVVVSGRVTGPCEGSIRVDALNAQVDTPSQQHGPMTVLELDAVGPFSLALPVDTNAILTAMCDNNRDGLIAIGVDALAEAQQLGVVTEGLPEVIMDLRLAGAESPSGFHEMGPSGPPAPGKP